MDYGDYGGHQDSSMNDQDHDWNKLEAVVPLNIRTTK